MCAICDKYKDGQIDGKQALMALSDSSKQADPKTRAKIEKHMFDLTETILGNEVPMPEVNQEADEAFWNATHRSDDQ